MSALLLELSDTATVIYATLSAFAVRRKKLFLSQDFGSIKLGDRRHRGSPFAIGEMSSRSRAR